MQGPEDTRRSRKRIGVGGTSDSDEDDQGTRDEKERGEDDNAGGAVGERSVDFEGSVDDDAEAEDENGATTTNGAKKWQRTNRR
ncbi:hypothetical protein Pcac1_g28315 [Phytophthora cactorum]|nr:hypothetical protein Pcac1_g28315 [Phytophthora cactorum]KAG2800286.1 hypothetical protein PC111_g20036 [Phytophthora cactorum]